MIKTLLLTSLLMSPLALAESSSLKTHVVGVKDSCDAIDILLMPENVVKYYKKTGYDDCVISVVYSGSLKDKTFTYAYLEGEKRKGYTIKRLEDISLTISGRYNKYK